ncbi:MAG: tRNA (adenosine(37)-N6)-threonylcarbamoyltransferase complex ATPase subunit type 1 TsaE [candidate division WWE3 bacterium]|nr:tRNA (adenosine(37)-N6)-threonylcarbamoyltransferase complex ATPase subunit type 1 TsaE [candidate division WWE3 bacterium]
MVEVITKNSDETKKIAAQICTKLKSGNVLALQGDLGSGKTTFTQGLAKALGVKSRVLSPTFTILRQYKIENSKFSTLNHLDCYRVSGPSDLESLDILNLCGQPNSLTIIEWPERIACILPKTTLKISFETLEGQQRKIILPEELKI